MKAIFVLLLIATCSFSIFATNLITENISTWTNHSSLGSYTQAITAGTVTMTQCIVTNNASANGTCSVGRVQMNSSNGVLQLPQLSSIGTVEFHMVASGTSRSVKLQQYNGSTWVDVTTFSGIGTTGATFTYALNTTSAATIRLSTPSNTLYVHDIIISDYVPTINVTGTFNPFSTTTGSASASQSVAVSGTSLSSTINVATVTGYEYSTTNAAPWTSTLSLASSFNGSVYVRLSGTSLGSYAGDISFTSTGASEVLRDVSGAVNAPPIITPDPQPGLILGDINNYYAPNASGPLDIPSYIQYNGVNEIVHPDVIYFSTAWNGYHYWMAYTPFPNNDATAENPCIAVSNDNVTWVVPPGLTNPIDSYSANANDYYSDPEIIMDPTQTTMNLLWRRYKNGQFEKLYVMSSTNGITWSSKVDALTVDVNSESLISPAVVYDGTQYLLWTVDIKVSPRIVRLRTASSIAGPWSASVPTNILPLTYDTNNNPLTETWHINVTKIGSQYWMINNDTAIGGSNGVNLYLGISDDGINWTFASHPVLYARNNYLYWDQKLYRASMIPIYDGQQMGFSIWYSVMRKATDTNPPWRIGYTEAWCAPRNTRLQSGRNDDVTLAWDGFVSVYQKTTTYKVQHTSTPYTESSWQDATSWSSSLTYTFLRNAYEKHFFRVKAKVE